MKALIINEQSLLKATTVSFLSFDDSNSIQAIKPLMINFEKTFFWKLNILIFENFNQNLFLPENRILFFIYFYINFAENLSNPFILSL